MTFNPLRIFSEKAKSKETPPRGPGGKFVSAKPKEEKRREAKGSAVKGPFPLTFYGHEIRRFYKDNAWFFSLEDIAHVAYINANDPTVRKGNPEKLSEAKKKYAIQIDGVEVAKPKDIVKFIPYFKGNMPGPITSWLVENSDLPLPQPVESL